MKQKYYLPIETAKRLKELGYNHQDHYWMINEGEEPYIINLYDKLDYEDDGVNATFIPTCTYHETIDWFKEKNILFSITCDFYVNTIEPWYRGIVITSNNMNNIVSNACSSYEECLNELIKKALTYVTSNI